ncbi:MAG: 6-phospho-beta-glucosidase, partial [Actinomycetota bacterium]|nr:6-phospho-beta-glucosidase [Actinomycetota bacterium]
MGVKVAVVGAGSTYTPELVEGFVTRGDRLPIDELVLLDIDQERLDIVGALAERMALRAGWSGTVRRTLSPEGAI